MSRRRILEPEHPIAPLRVLAFCMQAGGGLVVYTGGVANLDGCNVYSNEAQVSARLTPLPGPFLQRPAGTLRVLAFCMQAGGGLFIDSGGVANLDGCNVYSNEAYVSARLTPLP